MNEIIAFDSPAGLPAYLTPSLQTGVTGNVADFGSGGFPILSIKGKVWAIRRGDERTLITKPETPDEPAGSLELLILGIGPAGNNYSKVWYATKYEEGSDNAPDCSSNDGISPDEGVPNPQAAKCALCPQNQWGAVVTESGKKAKACSDSKRLAVAAPGAVKDPMLLRIPAASLKTLREFGQYLSKRGVKDSFAVVTKAGFDYTVSHPQVTFKPIGWASERDYRDAVEMAGSDLVKQIIGMEAPSHLPDAPAHVAASLAAPAPAPVAAPAPAPVAAPAPAPVAAPAPAPAPAPAAVQPIVDAVSMSLDDLDFDD